MKILYKLKWIYILGIFILFLVNCNPLKIFGAGNISEVSSLLPIDGLNTSHIPNETYFYLNINNSYYVGEGFDEMQSFVYAMDSGPGTDCKIRKPDNPVEGNTEDLYCIMEIMEGDLWFHRIVLEYNIPSEMCDYLGIDVPWHFNQKVGKGPNTVYECNDYQIGTDESGDPITATRYCLAGTSGCPSGTTGEGCCRTTIGDNEVTRECSGEGGRGIDEVQKFCGALDQSENDLANCCLGEYNLISDDTAVPSTWGGNLQDCIGGLGRISWDDFDAEGLPKSKKINVRKNGINESYEIPPLIEIYGGHKHDSRLLRPTFITANYWTDVEDKDFATNTPKFYLTPDRAQLPAPYLEVSPIAGHPYLSLSCLNKANEIKHRIHLVIREWNTQQEFNRFVDSEGSDQADPDVVGVEGSFCEYYEADESEILPRDTNCNDSYDVDDWNNSDHGSSSSRAYNPYPEIIYNN